MKKRARLLEIAATEQNAYVYDRDSVVAAAFCLAAMALALLVAVVGATNTLLWFRAPVGTVRVGTAARIPSMLPGGAGRASRGRRHRRIACCRILSTAA